MVQAALDTLRAQGSPQGTVRQYKSNWNFWVPEEIGRSQCREASLWHWTKIFDHLESESATESTITAVARTLGTMIEWGSDRGYFGAEPFGPAAKRGRVVEKAGRRAKVKRPPDKKISLDMCPTVANVEDFAQAVEAQYPQYGERLVYLAYGSGLRICELLSLKSDSIDLATGDIAVDTQLDRYGKWPDVQLPKGGKTRVAFLWRCYWDVAASLVKDAEARTGDEHGWLFPRHRSVTKWADQAGKLIGTAVSTAEDWHWTFHWLRHGYASVSCLVSLLLVRPPARVDPALNGLRVDIELHGKLGRAQPRLGQRRSYPLVGHMGHLAGFATQSVALLEGMN